MEKISNLLETKDVMLYSVEIVFTIFYIFTKDFEIHSSKSKIWKHLLK
jgi:hypothetical protein